MSEISKYIVCCLIYTVNFAILFNMVMKWDFWWKNTVNREVPFQLVTALKKKQKTIDSEFKLTWV